MKPQTPALDSDTPSEPLESDSINDTERAVLVRRLGSSFAHVLANSLNVIGMRASMLGLARDAQSVARAAAEISEHVTHISGLFDQIQRYADALEPRAELVDVKKEAAVALAKAKNIANSSQNLEIVSGTRWEVMLPRAVVGVVLSNLFEFALRMGSSGRSVELAVERVTRGTNQLEVLKIRLLLPRGKRLPTDRRALLDPWLSPGGDVDRERILLACAVGAVRDRGGWFEAHDDPNPALTLYWPARASHIG